MRSHSRREGELVFIGPKEGEEMAVETDRKAHCPLPPFTLAFDEGFHLPNRIVLSQRLLRLGDCGLWIVDCGLLMWRPFATLHNGDV